MKKEIIISSVAILLIVTPVFAKQEGSKENTPKNNQNNNQNHKNETVRLIQSVTAIPTVTVSISPSAPKIEKLLKKEKKEDENDLTEDENDNSQLSPSASPSCSPEDKYKNHGKYVSCVAHESEGGDDVSEAAQSNIGKKHEDNEDDSSQAISTTITPTITASTSPTISPISSSLPTIHFGFNPLRSFGDLWHRFTGFFRHLKFRV